MKSQTFYEKTMNGGDYWTIVYTNKMGDRVEQSEATNFIVYEYTNDGELVHTAYGFYGSQEDTTKK